MDKVCHYNATIATSRTVVVASKAKDNDNGHDSSKRHRCGGVVGGRATCCDVAVTITAATVSGIVVVARETKDNDKGHRGGGTVGEEGQLL